MSDLQLDAESKLRLSNDYCSLARTSLQSDTNIKDSSEEWKPTKKFYISFGILCFAFLLSAFESSVVGNVLPSVASSLNLGNAYIWCSVAFLLSSAIAQPFIAQLQDVVGRKVPMLVSVLIFALGSICCGAANGKAVLILGRVVQGIGTSGIDMIGETIIGDLVPLRFRPKWGGIKQGVFAFGTLLGPLLGGTLTAHASWRWVFYMNVPLCVIVGVLIGLVVKLNQPHERDLKSRLKRMKAMDFPGITALALTLIFGTTSLSSERPLTLFAAMLMGLTSVIAWQIFAGRSEKHREVLFMPPRLFKHLRTSVIGLFNIFIWGGVVYGTQLILPIHLQAIKGDDPMKSGYEMLPITAALVIFSSGSGYALSRVGNRKGAYKWMQVVGMALMTAGTSGMTVLDERSPKELLFASMVLAAVGSGSCVPTFLPSILVELEDADNATATGNWAFFRTVGSVIGCLLPAICLNVRVEDGAKGLNDEGARERLLQKGLWNLASAKFLQELPLEDQALVKTLFTAGLRTTFIIFAAASGLATLVAIAFKALPMREGLDTAFGLQEAAKEDTLSKEEEGEAGA
ncbi:MAG: hypothetical protein Q9159_004617 [Coniocarpon cinnabarinum]